MNSEHDSIIDRYMNGQMNPIEEVDFRKLLELDPDLRRLLEAERFVQGVMTKDSRVLAERDHSRTYSSFLQGLASSAIGSRGEPSTVPLATVPASDSEQWSHRRQAALSLVILLTFVGLVMLIARYDSDNVSTISQPQPAMQVTPNVGERSSRTLAPSADRVEAKDPSASATHLRRKSITPAIEQRAGDLPIDSPKPHTTISSVVKELSPLTQRRDRSPDKPVPHEPQPETPTFYDDTLRTHIDLTPKQK